VPGGASCGKFEAKTVEVDRAIKNINEIIAPKLKELDATKQEEIDKLLLELDGTEDKSNLGANAIVGVSMAICKLGAKIQEISLWRHINNISKVKSQKSKLPKVCFNIINGGKHAGNDLAIQEFMIVPQKEIFSENLELAANKLNQMLESMGSPVKVKLSVAFSELLSPSFHPVCCFSRPAFQCRLSIVHTVA